MASDQHSNCLRHFWYIFRIIQNRLNARIKLLEFSVNEALIPGICKEYVVTHTNEILKLSASLRLITTKNIQYTTAVVEPLETMS